MPQAKVIDGTPEELSQLLQSGVFKGHAVSLVIDPEELDWSTVLPPPPFAVDDQARLIELLREGLDSLDKENGIKVTAETWTRAHEELERRFRAS